MSSKAYLLFIGAALLLEGASAAKVTVDKEHILEVDGDAKLVVSKASYQEKDRRIRQLEALVTQQETQINQLTGGQASNVDEDMDGSVGADNGQEYGSKAMPSLLDMGKSAGINPIPGDIKAYRDAMAQADGTMFGKFKVRKLKPCAEKFFLLRTFTAPNSDGDEERHRMAVNDKGSGTWSKICGKDGKWYTDAKAEFTRCNPDVLPKGDGKASGYKYLKTTMKTCGVLIHPLATAPWEAKPQGTQRCDKDKDDAEGGAIVPMISTAVYKFLIPTETQTFNCQKWSPDVLDAGGENKGIRIAIPANGACKDKKLDATVSIEKTIRALQQGAKSDDDVTPIDKAKFIADFVDCQDTQAKKDEITGYFNER